MKDHPVIVAIHAHGHDDGCQSVIKWLTWQATGPKTVVEAPYPLSAADAIARAHIAPQRVTGVVLLADARTFEADPYGQWMRTVCTQNGVTHIALGHVASFDAAASAFDKAIGAKTLGLIHYLESYIGVSVAYLAIDDDTLIIRKES